MKRLTCIAILIGVVSAISAQNVPPALFVEESDGHQSRLRIAMARVDTTVHGQLAETEMTLRFYNPSAREREGTFYFPLPDGATVTGYALDIEGIMVDGVVVEKRRGREVFEAIVRQGIDPGLVEWTVGNNFKTRIFPIPRQGSRTIRIRYVSELTGQENRNLYELPLRFDEEIGEFSIRVEVVKPDQAPELVSGGLAKFSFEQWRDSYVAEYSGTDVLLNEDIVIALPETGAPDVSVERGIDGKVYFAVHNDEDVPAYMTDWMAPKGITIYWDASYSQIDADHTRSFELLASYFESLNTPVQVELILLRNVPERSKSFEIRDGRATTLISFLEEIPYDGATAISNLPLPSARSELALLFSDGIINYGEAEVPAIGIPLYTFSTSSESNFPYLRYLAYSNGGEFFSIKVLSDDEVVPRIGRKVYSLLSVEVLSGSVSNVYPTTPFPVMSDTSISGILESKNAEILLKYGVHGQVLREEPFIIESGHASEGTLLRINWAQQKLEDLLALEAENKDTIINLGKEFGFVTPGTSLIVLENLNQYVQYQIAPPETMPEMREEYFRLISRQDREKSDKKQQKLEWVLELWQQRIEWWKTDFNVPKNYLSSDRNGDDTTSSGAAAPVATSSAAEEEVEDTAVAEPQGMAREQEAPRAAPEAEPDGGADEANESADTGAGAPDETRTGLIELKPWSPDTPYISALDYARPGERYRTYLAQRHEYGDSPAFFLDCGDYFLKKEDPALAYRMWSNIVEMELENAALIRVLAHRLSQADDLEMSSWFFRKVVELRPEDPQSFRDLGLVLGRLKKYEESMALLWKVVTDEWSRFEEVELVTLMELNNVIYQARLAGMKEIAVDPRFIRSMEVDLRIVLTWDADLTDMDLWVTEPTGEQVDYSNKFSVAGSFFGRDFTDGYGPEEYMLKKAIPGEYVIQVNYYGSSSPALTGSVILQVEVFTDWGRVDETRRSITVQLKEQEQVVDVGVVTF